MTEPSADVPGAPTSGERSLGARDVLRLRDFRHLFAAQAISDVGDGMTYLALYLLVLETTGSTAMVALLAVLIALPPITIGLVAGAVADRLDRRRILIASDMLRAGGVLALAGLATLGGAAVPLVLLVALAQAAVGTFFSPARAALIPRVVPEHGLVAANSLGQTSRVIGSVAGLAITGAIVGTTGLIWMAFVLDAMTFLVSAALVLRVDRAVGRIAPSVVADARSRGVRGSVVDGLRVITRSRPLVAVLTGVVVSMLGTGAIYVLFVPFVVRDLGASPAWIGPIEGAQSVSMILAGIALAAAGARIPVSTLFVVGLAGEGLCIASLSLATEPWMVAVTLFAQGWFFLPLQTTIMTIVQQATTDEVRGRVMGAVSSATQSSMVASMAAAGIFSDTLGIRTTLQLAGAIGVVGAIVALVLFRSGRRPAPAGAPA